MKENQNVQVIVKKSHGRQLDPRIPKVNLCSCRFFNLKTVSGNTFLYTG